MHCRSSEHRCLVGASNGAALLEISFHEARLGRNPKYPETGLTAQLSHELLIGKISLPQGFSRATAYRAEVELPTLRSEVVEFLAKLII